MPVSVVQDAEGAVSGNIDPTFLATIISTLQPGKLEDDPVDVAVRSR